MTERRWIILLGVLLLALAATATVWAASAGQEPDPQGPSLPVGTSFTYQGRLRDGGEPVNDTCEMAFQLFDGIGPGDRPVGDTISLKVPVSEGLFTVELDFGSAAFRGAARWLGVTVQCPGDKVPVNLGRQELTAVPYALYALEAPWGGLPYAGVVVVAKGGGDYASVQAAIDSITGASAERPYLVWIAPGVYEEQVTMEPYVHLQGAGQEATVLHSTAGADFPTQATLTLASQASLRDLTVSNSGANEYNVAILATAGTTGTLVTGVRAWTEGNGTYHHGFYLRGSGTAITLREVTALGEYGSVENCGLTNTDGAVLVLDGGSFTGRGGESAKGICNTNSDTSLEAEGVTARGEDGSAYNFGMVNRYGALARLRGGSFSGQGGVQARGIESLGNGTLLEAEGVVALAESGVQSNRALANSSGATTRLRGGSFLGRGSAPADAVGIFSSGTGSELGAVSISVLGEGGPTSYGLWNSGGASNVTQSKLEGATYSVLSNDGTVSLSHVRLVDGVVDGGVTCVAVSRGSTFNASGCP